jgi:hypothetical protein
MLSRDWIFESGNKGVNSSYRPTSRSKQVVDSIVVKRIEST